MAAIKGVSPSVTAGGQVGFLGTWPTTGTITPVMPTGGGAPAAGDLIVLPVYNRVTTATVNDVTGYTRLTTSDFTSGANTAELWAKIAAGGDAAPTCTSTPTGQPMAALLIVVEDWSGDLADLVAAVAGSTGATVTCPDATATDDDSLVLRIGFQQDDNGGLGDPTPPPYTPWVPPAGHTSVFYEVTMAGSDAGMAVATETADTGAVGVGGFGTNGADAGIGFTLIIPPNGDVPPSVGAVSAPIALDVAVAGSRASQGAVSTAMVLDATIVGSARHAGAVSAPVVLDIAVSGARESAGAVSAPLSLDCEVSGARDSLGSVSAPLVLDIEVSGSRPAAGAVSVGIELDIEVHGSNGQSGRPVKTWPYGTEPISGYPWAPRPVKSFQEVDQP